MSMEYWPIVMYGVNISEFKPKDCYQDDPIDKEHYMPWSEILEHDDLDPDVKDFLTAHLGGEKEIELVYMTTGTMYDDRENIYVGIPAYHLFEYNGQYYSKFSQAEIRDAIVQVVQRYTNASDEEIRNRIEFVDAVGANN